MHSGIRVSDFNIPIQTATDVALARRTAQRVAVSTGLSESDAGALGVVVTEAATNLLKHGGGGDLILQDLGNAVEIIALDKGPGMSNVARSFVDGYSTAGSPGTGLGAIARLSRFHDLFSKPQMGTVLAAQVGPRNAPDPSGTEIAIGAVSVAYPGEEICGDAWRCEASGGRCVLIVADGLGHGIYAAEASRAALKMNGGLRDFNAAEFVNEAHLGLEPTRGCRRGGRYRFSWPHRYLLRCGQCRGDGDLGRGLAPPDDLEQRHARASDAKARAGISLSD